MSIPTGLGVGWLVAVLAGTVALGAAAWSYARGGSAAAAPGTGTDRPARSLIAGPAGLGWSRLGWTVATVALLGVGAVRAAGWLFALCLLTAGVTASLALVDGRSLRGMLLSLALPPVAVIRSLPWAVAGLARRTGKSNGGAGTAARGAAKPGDERGEGGGVQFGRVLLTAVISIVLLLVFGTLFASADKAFARLLGNALPEVSAAGVVRWIFLFIVVGAGLLGAAYLLARPPDVTGLTSEARTRVRPWEWAVPVALLDCLFLAFVLVQITVLFGGGEHVLRTAGLTYAEHARGGFWQLLVVSGLTLLVLAGAARWAPRTTPAHRMLIRVLLGALAALSLVVVASALYRMEVYTDAYGATRLRLLVFVCELWIGLVFLLVLVAGVRLRAGWLPQVAVASAVLALLGLAVLNPDRWIAERNVARHQQTGRIDIGYLSRLSADAAPALNRLPAPLRDCALGKIADELDRDDADRDWREANLGRMVARRLLADAPADSPHNPNCWSQRAPR